MHPATSVRGASKNCKIVDRRLLHCHGLPRASARGDDFGTIFSKEFEDLAIRLGEGSITEMMPNASRSAPLRQQIFTSPIIPFIYERLLPPLWSAGLRIGGVEQEYLEAASFIGGSGQGVLADVSCGTGFVAKRFASSGKFRAVVALDYSREMLEEMRASLPAPQSANAPALALVRGDAGSLPFRDGALEAVHWGAAMHCVPDAARAMREIYRVLEPGGKLYATTFLRPFPDLVFRFFEPAEVEAFARSRLQQISRSCSSGAKRAILWHSSGNQVSDSSYS